VEEAVSPIVILPVTWDPRTRPEEYLNLADLHEGRARNREVLIANSEELIRRYETSLARDRAIETEQRSQGMFESNPAGGGLSPGGGAASANDDRPAQIALEREKIADYIAARDAYREQARRARAFAAGREP
jgi:hypothetical protein